MKASVVREKYLKFFEKKGHKVIPGAPLVLDNDPTTLFTSSGMQPLVPYLMGETHPEGKRLVDSQPSIRTQDIEEVGDNRHTTFFEMLGNWSLGDYFKENQLPWIWEFLTEELSLPKEKLYVSIFEGNESVPRDVESYDIWRKLGVAEDHIYEYGVKKNWWSRSGPPENMPAGEIGGPDSEIFYDFGEELKLHENSAWKGDACHPNCDCGRFMEIGNSVFIQYKKKEDGTLEELPQKNVDFGGGLERICSAIKNDPDVFKTDLLWPLISKIEEISGKKYSENQDSFRIICDHIRAATFIMSYGVPPKSDDRHGGVLRKLLERARNEGELLGIKNNFLSELSNIVIDIYKKTYPYLVENKTSINQSTTFAEMKIVHIKSNPPKITQKINVLNTIDNGEILINMQKYLNKYTGGAVNPHDFLKSHSLSSLPSVYAGTVAFDARGSSGFPVNEVAKMAHQSLGGSFNINDFNNTLNIWESEHKKKSQIAGSKLFKGGLADNSDAVTRLHTAHHLLLASLQKLVDPNIKQRGSNITAERLRMDFNFERKLTADELKKVEDLMNEKIDENLPVTKKIMPKAEAESIGAQMEFGAKYPDNVNVYFVGDAEDYFSAEFCGGPHVTNTSQIGHVRMIKQEKVGAGIIRIYATNKS